MRTNTTIAGQPVFYQNNRIGSHINISFKYEFTVVLKSDSSFTGEGKINISDSVHRLALKREKEVREFLPQDTKEIYRVSKNGEKIIGIPSDYGWLFLTDSGKINCYAYIAEPGTPYIAMIQKADTDEIFMYGKFSVQLLVEEDEKAIKLADKGKLYQAIKQYNRNDL